MRFIDKPVGKFFDRKIEEPQLEPIDVLIPTLDEETFLEKCLFTIYREIPARKLIVCDGGSSDKTIEILKKFPRVELHIRKDIRTFAKVMEFLFSKAETSWFAVMDAHLELPEGWYEEMSKHKDQFDVLENNRRIRAHHFYRDDPIRLEKFRRPSEWCHLIKKKSTKNFLCDDDYLWRETDVFFRQQVEKAGFHYGKIDSITHVHNETEKILYQSDDEKNFIEVIYHEPDYKIIDEKKYKDFKINNAKGIAKYLDPQNEVVKFDKFIDAIKILDRTWLEKHAPKWLELYDNATKLKMD